MKLTQAGFARALAIALLPALTGIAIPFTHLYLLNVGNLLLPLKVHLLHLAILCGALTGLLLALQLLLPHKTRTATSWIVLLLGVIVWAEATLFIGDFGFLQGGDIEWDEARHLLYLEAAFLVILALAIRFFGQPILKHATTIVVLLVVSGIANLYPAWQASRSIRHAELDHTFTDLGLFDLSPDRNVLLFILDTYQSDVFAEVIERNPALRESLQGFTYFPDATSGYCRTYTSVPNLLTGQVFDNSIPFPDYLRESFLSNSAPKILKDHGFDARYHSFSLHSYYPDPAIADNLTEIESTTGRRWMQGREFVQLLNLSVFRLSPFLLKPWVYNDNSFRLRGKLPIWKKLESTPLEDNDRVLSAGNDSDDLEFHDRMIAWLSTSSARPTFRVYHLRGTHRPYVLDQDLNYTGRREISRPGIVDQGEAMLKLLALEFDRLREIGAFDNSLVFVLGDHGAGEHEIIGIRQAAAHIIGEDIHLPEESPDIPWQVIQGGIPLVLVKGIDDTEPFRISRAPVELADIPNTIFAALNLNDAVDGSSVFDIAPDAPRVRTHHWYEYAGWGQDYIVPMIEYSVQGFSWDPTSWSRTENDLNRNALSSLDGTLVIMGQDGNLDEFEHSGWGEFLPQGRRVANGIATITLPIRPGTTSSALQFRFNPNWLNREQNHFRLSVNGRMLDVIPYRLGGENNIGLKIPDDLLANATSLRVEIELVNSALEGPVFIEFREVSSFASAADGG
ncbi:hypothetical protein DRQ53_08790 [bacterium]|nr:MAG: hypothetical protein DRQ53_08790 [bacterium]